MKTWLVIHPALAARIIELEGELPPGVEVYRDIVAEQLVVRSYFGIVVDELQTVPKLEIRLTPFPAQPTRTAQWKRERNQFGRRR